MNVKQTDWLKVDNIPIPLEEGRNVVFCCCKRRLRHHRPVVVIKSTKLVVLVSAQDGELIEGMSVVRPKFDCSLIVLGSLTKSQKPNQMPHTFVQFF